MILGFESESSDEEQMHELPSREAIAERKKILNFNKIYPKKFPDFSKNPDFK